MHTHSCVTHAHSCVTHTHSCVSWRIQMCSLSHLDVWHDAIRCATWLILMHDTDTWMRHVMAHSATWLILFLCDMAHSNAWHGINVPCHAYNQHVIWPMHMCAIAHSYQWHDSFIRVTWLIYMCDMTHLYAWRAWFMCVTHSYVWLDYVCHQRDSNANNHPYTMNESCHTYERVMSHTWISHATHLNHTYEWVMSQTWMSHVTHMNESCHTYEHMGWLCLVGSIKL